MALRYDHTRCGISSIWTFLFWDYIKLIFFEKIKWCKIPERTKEEINHIKSLSKEDFDRDYENNKKFLLNVVEDCKSDIIKNNLLKDKDYNSNVETYLKEINEFKTKIENISN